MNNFTENDYILFIGQEANFQSRSMLIPAKEFIEARKEDYEMLKKTSAKNYVFQFDGMDHQIDNLLLQNYIWEDNMGKQEIREYTQVCNQLTHYADGMDDNCYFDMKDKIWYDKAICNICSGFNHIKNYTKAKNMTMYKKKPINIVDSFLFIELRNGILEMPSCDTVEEMFQKYYSK
ncbi:hypothetical protein QKU48_gp0752 [Fadolivirus algeromassiliense]|jgi:hypothetical protein|uniref:Uncharacterized protein n=1 Tax=Fadolivirus FV1/VV64 TaxID=3070911 RepID=A0A7D3UTD4_9VIRU|nr:hypothetical protein QKU48_gp0752 [Fadolivirus algeromassiliense]QKF94210.1 hypothetical protein Fadolivirus_1_752 [Fadolivirus FV1/VV64]